MAFLFRVFQGVCSLLLSSASVMVLHGWGYYPDRWVAELILQAAPTPAQAEWAFWLVVGVAAVVVYPLLGWVWRLLSPTQRTIVNKSESTSFDPPDWEPLGPVFKWIIEQGEVGSWMRVDKVARKIRQAALSGSLDIRGRKEINRMGPGDRFDSVRSNIPSDYWQTHEFDLTVVLDGSADSYQPETVVVGNMSAESLPHYRGLQANMKQVKRLWP